MRRDDPDRKLVIVEKELSYQIVGAFFDVYNELGHGLLESIYVRALEITLRERGIAFERERAIPVFYHGQDVGPQRLDMLIEGRVIVEVKATEILARAAREQLRSYVRATRLPLGLLLHFGPAAKYFRELGPLPNSPRIPFA